MKRNLPFAPVLRVNRIPASSAMSLNRADDDETGLGFWEWSEGESRRGAQAAFKTRAKSAILSQAIQRINVTARPRLHDRCRAGSFFLPGSFAARRNPRRFPTV